MYAHNQLQLEKHLFRPIIGQFTDKLVVRQFAD